MTIHRVGRALSSLAACGLLLATSSGVRAAAPVAAAPASATYDVVADFSVAAGLQFDDRRRKQGGRTDIVSHDSCRYVGTESSHRHLG